MGCPHYIQYHPAGFLYPPIRPQNGFRKRTLFFYYTVFGPISQYAILHNFIKLILLFLLGQLSETAKNKLPRKNPGQPSSLAVWATESYITQPVS